MHHPSIHVCLFARCDSCTNEREAKKEIGNVAFTLHAAYIAMCRYLTIYYICFAETTNLQRASAAAQRWQDTRDSISHGSSRVESIAERGNRRAGWSFVGATESAGLSIQP